MPSNPIDQFISTYPPEVQTILQKIRAAIHKSAPGAEEALAYGIPAKVDKYHLYENYGYLINRFQPSSETYREFIRGVFQLYMLGPTLQHIESALNVIGGLPVVRDDGEVLREYDTSAADQDVIRTLRPDGSTAEYVYPKDTPMREDIVAWAPGDPDIEFLSFEPLTLMFVVTDYVQDPTWWESIIIPQELLPGESVLRRTSVPALYENVIGALDGPEIGDPGLFIGADDEGNVPANPLLPAKRRRFANVVLNTFLKYHVCYVHVDPIAFKKFSGSFIRDVTLYNRIKKNPRLELTPRTFIFGGKAAPGYFMAKLIIKLINSVAGVVNHDPDVRDRLKVVFFPDYNVKNAQHVYPAADLSEQISTAGKEASGTGNMKFSLNGALTIGTLDGANVEIREEVGAENFFLFGLTAEQVQELKARGYHPHEHYEHNATLREVLDFISSGALADGDPNLFRPHMDNLLHHDPFLVLADYQAYIDCQAQLSALWRDPQAWTRKASLNVARMGKFSSDRSIRDYCEQVWKVKPMVVT